MMYNQKLAVAIKTNGKVLREFKDTVYVPFGSEYSILVKNLNTVRAVVNIAIDGVDAVPGGLVLAPGREVDLERWIKNGNLNEGNRFKFIEHTESIEQHRGVKLEDGIVRIEYQFERPVKTYWKPDEYQFWTQNQFNWPKEYHSDSSGNRPQGGTLRGMGVTYTANVASGSTRIPMNATVGQASSALSNGLVGQAQSFNDAGITVPGSKSEQKFVAADWFPTETEKHVMVLKLLGETPNNKPVLQPVTVKAKQRCETCGHTNKATAKFCNKCGTALEIFA